MYNPHHVPAAVPSHHGRCVTIASSIPSHRQTHLSMQTLTTATPNTLFAYLHPFFTFTSHSHPKHPKPPTLQSSILQPPHPSLVKHPAIHSPQILPKTATYPPKKQKKNKQQQSTHYPNRQVSPPQPLSNLKERVPANRPGKGKKENMIQVP